MLWIYLLLGLITSIFYTPYYINTQVKPNHSFYTVEQYKKTQVLVFLALIVFAFVVWLELIYNGYIKIVRGGKK